MRGCFVNILHITHIVGNAGVFLRSNGGKLEEFETMHVLLNNSILLNKSLARISFSSQSYSMDTKRFFCSYKQVREPLNL